MSIQKVLIRLIDIIGACIGIIISILPIIIIGIQVKKDGGPVLFKQKRIGKDGKPFVMLKIRSMVIDASVLRANLIQQSDVEGMFKMKNDPRVTDIGKYIRKHSLDELPQFWNVLRGDMSLVGPRPALDEEVREYSENEKKRLLVKPGMTGLWQVSGRNNVSFDDMIQLDLKYIDNQTLIMNISILFKTIILMFRSEENGAY